MGGLMQPSYKSGFYSPRRGGIAKYPQLWRGCVGAWAPCLGSTGLSLYDQSKSNWGTLTNMDPATDWVMSNGRYALDFDGSNDHVAIGSYAPLNTSRPFTFSAWIRLSLFVTGYPVIAQFRGNSGAVAFSLSNQAHYLGMLWGSDNGAWGQFRNGIAAAVWPGVWNHVAYCYNGLGATSASNYRSYLNGVEVAVLTAAAFGGRENLSFIGNERAVGGFPWLGMIDSIMLHDRMLVADEVKTLSSRRGIAYELSQHQRTYSVGQRFKAAWARGANQFIQPSMIGVA